MSGITENDLQLLEQKGISREKVSNQIDTFKEGIPFVDLAKAAIVGDGISKFSSSEEEGLVKNFEEAKSTRSLLKFVPASGAASRMFKALFNFLDAYEPSKESLDSYLERTNDSSIKQFSERITEFPFYSIVQGRIADKSLSQGEEVHAFIKELLSDEGLNYGFYPKGLLPFHKYGEQTATPFEEHLKEGANYAKSAGSAKLHFTISEQHSEMFKTEFNTVEDRVKTVTNTSFTIGYSYQKASTDTIAVNMDNTPFRNEDGSLLFRPGGHGALIENLNEQEADVIFIKNIDNVVVPENAESVTHSKKVLAGLLLKVQQKAFMYAKLLAGHQVSDDQLNDIKQFLHENLNVRFTTGYDSLDNDEQVKVLKDKINRPIRICGMVKNEGEPGGGPFWIKDANGNISLQIIESAQIDTSKEDQKALLNNATHFNPVDLVCGVCDYSGKKFNLLNFVDPKQGFITEKTKDGKDLKALELPGLWNGAMAFWNTIFVEVESATFNPVKTVNDLLKPSHQVK